MYDQTDTELLRFRVVESTLGYGGWQRPAILSVLEPTIHTSKYMSKSSPNWYVQSTLPKSNPVELKK